MVLVEYPTVDIPLHDAHEETDTTIPNWISQLNSGNENEQTEAAQHLAENGTAALDELRVALVFGREGARESAAWAIAEIGGEEAVVALIPAIQDGSERVRVAAAQGLGRLGSMQARVQLELATTGDPSNTVRYAARKALISIRTAANSHNN